jgi:hypothetical protein
MGLHEFWQEYSWIDCLLLHPICVDGDLLLSIWSTNDASVDG